MSRTLLRTAPRGAVVAAIRETLAAARTRRAGPPEDWAAEIRERLTERRRPGLRPVLNATGVVLHTNLGRAPLAPAAIDAVTAVAAGYSNLELDLDTGTRGSRTDHCRELLRRLTGAEDALVVNNAAGALVLALNAARRRPRRADLARRADRDRRVVPHSRHHGPERRPAARGGHHQPHPPGRLPAGARRRRPGRSSRSIAPTSSSAASSRRPSPRRSRRSRRRRASPTCSTWAAGSWRTSRPWGLDSEPRVADALAAGAGLVLFSGDKLLGGPQAGCLVGGRRWSRAAARTRSRAPCAPTS